MIKINSDPPPRDVFLFSFLWFPLFIAIMGGTAWYWMVFHFGFESTAEQQKAVTISTRIWLGGAALIVGFGISQKFAKYFMLGMMYIGLPVGYVFSHVVMVAVWFLVMSPIGLILRVTGNDVLKEKIDKSAETYWVERTRKRTRKDYFRQF